MLESCVAALRILLWLHEKKKAAENKKWAKEIEKQAMVKQQELQRKIDDQA